MGDFSKFKIGGISYPLDATAVDSAKALKDADPALYYALDYYLYMIRTYVGARLVAECVAMGIKGPSGAVVDNAVKRATSLDPATNLTEAQLNFPLLALYRVSSKSAQHTVVYFDDVGYLKLAYIFPPLSAGQRQRLLPMIQAVKLLLQRATQMGMDAGYTPHGGTLGQQWFPLAGIEEIQLESTEYGDWGAPGGDLSFPGVEMVLQIKDRGSDLQGLGPFSGVDVDLQISDGSTALDAVLLNTSIVPPNFGP